MGLVTNGPPATLEKHCSVARTLEILGDPWAFLTLRGCFFGLRRFNQIQEHGQVPRRLLAGRLRSLVERGILVRRQYEKRPPRFEYRLTENGIDLYGPTLAQMAWGDRWMSTHDGPPLVLTHRPCKQAFHALIVCSNCSEPVKTHDVRYTDGPGAGYSPRSAGPRPRRSARPDIYHRGRPCSVARALGVIGDRWTFLVLREMFFGVHRFDEMHRSLGIARNILTDRLQTVVANGIVTRRLYRTRPDRFEYRLTPKGLDLYPSILAMIAWGDRWAAGDAGAPLLLFHKSCGARFTPLVVCSACRTEVKAREVTYASGPGGSVLAAGLSTPE